MKFEIGDLQGIITFLKETEKLKTTLRSGFTSAGRSESVTDHSWRLCLMAMMVQPYYPEIDFEKLIRIFVIHDLSEAVNGDIPAPEQDPFSAKNDQERKDYLRLIEALPETWKSEMIDLWDEYNEAKTPEAKLAKALDKLETILQHNQGKNPEDFDYAFNLNYGTAYTNIDPLISFIREEFDKETLKHSKAQDHNHG